MYVRWLTLLFSSYRWASLLLAMEMLSLSPILAAVWHLAASHLASSSMACLFPFCSTSSPTTTPSWRNRNTNFQTQNAPSSSGNVWGASLINALNPSRRTPMMRSTIGPVGCKPSMRSRIERSCLVKNLLTLNGLTTHGSRKCKTPSASHSEPVWFKINNLRVGKWRQQLR